MMAFVSDLLNFLQNDRAARGAVIAFAAFGVPLFSILLHLLFRILSVRLSPMVSSLLVVLVMGYTFGGFITQLILFMSYVPALKMALIWLAMVLVYGLFVLFNHKMIYKMLMESRESGEIKSNA